MKINQIEPLGISSDLQDYYQNLARKNGFELKIWNDRPTEKAEIINRARNAEVLIVSNIPLDKEILNNLPDLKMISVAFTGLDHIDLDFCAQRNIMVKNAAGYSTTSVAELTVGMMISLLRDMVPNSIRTKEGEGRNGYTGMELKNKTVGIIGMGRIGKEVARLCNAFGCNVKAWNRSSKKIRDVQFLSLENLLKSSDIVSLHVPLTKETKGLIDSNRLALMKPTAFLINTARGAVIDSVALLQALENKQIAGAALDIYEYEPPLLPDYLLLKAKNILMLPHIAYATQEAFDLRAKIVFDNIFDWKQNLENPELPKF
jgi:D-3-phosphoglycerate dehydrogenase